MATFTTTGDGDGVYSAYGGYGCIRCGGLDGAYGNGGADGVGVGGSAASVYAGGGSLYPSAPDASDMADCGLRGGGTGGGGVRPPPTLTMTAVWHAGHVTATRSDAAADGSANGIGCRQRVHSTLNTVPAIW